MNIFGTPKTKDQATGQALWISAIFWLALQPIFLILMAVNP